MEIEELEKLVRELRRQLTQLGVEVEKRKAEARRKKLPERVMYVADMLPEEKRNLLYESFCSDDCVYIVRYSGDIVLEFRRDSEGVVDVDAYVPGEWERLLEDDYRRALEVEREYLETEIRTIKECWGL